MAGCDTDGGVGTLAIGESECDVVGGVAAAAIGDGTPAGLHGAAFSLATAGVSGVVGVGGGVGGLCSTNAS